MKLKCRLSQLLTSLIIGILLPSSASAYVVYGGTKYIKVGEEIELETEPSTYYTVTGSWTREGNSCNFVSRSNRHCTIRGIKAGETTIRWEGVVGSADYEYYWYIEVSGDPEPPGPGPGPDPNPDPDPEPAPAPEASWADSYDISWYNKNNNEFVVSTNKELSGVAYLVNNGYTTFKGKTIKLGKNIDLSEKRWTTIGITKSQPFEGSFDGQNHTISGIYITLQDSQQTFYGFFGVFAGVSILNTIFKGVVNINNPIFEYESSNFDVGGIVGRIDSKATISRCVSDMDIYLKKSSYSDNGNSRVGGILGFTEYACKISSCSHRGNIHVGDYDGKKFNLPYIGGIAGISYFAVIEMCENYSSIISCHSPSIRGLGSNAYIGGITGNGGKAYYCRSIINKIELKNEHSGGTWFNIGGIGSSAAINCYSIINDINLNSVDIWYNAGGIRYGGISAENNGSSSKANFSNSDYSVDKPYLLTFDAGSGYHGDDSFSSEQMKTDNFLNQLNTYSFVEEGKGIWTADENGYPCIAEIHYTTGINRTILNKETDKHVYNLNGQQLMEPRKGINIIGGKKVVVK